MYFEKGRCILIRFWLYNNYVIFYRARYGTFHYAPVKEPYRSDYLQSIESKKRKMASPNSSIDAPVVKKQANAMIKEGKRVVGHQ